MRPRRSYRAQFPPHRPAAHPIIPLSCCSAHNPTALHPHVNSAHPHAHGQPPLMRPCGCAPVPVCATIPHGGNPAHRWARCCYKKQPQRGRRRVTHSCTGAVIRSTGAPSRTASCCSSSYSGNPCGSPHCTPRLCNRWLIISAVAGCVNDAAGLSPYVR